MLPLARLWTWTGHLFIPSAIGFAIYIRSGLPGELPQIGVIVSRAYLGLIVALVAGIVLVWAFALYVRAAKKLDAPTFVPPNTTFEDEKARNPIVSWGTVVAFCLSIILALIIFGARYAQSRIFEWDAQSALWEGFWRSRWIAHRLGCPSQPCFAVGPHMDGAHPINGVVEYILYVTDGAILVLACILISGLAYLAAVSLRKRSEPILY
jgi:hypothetical protein